jgi:predicted nucleic acid-binding protein
MEVVVDASVLIAGLMADGRARHALLHAEADLVAPPFALEEVAARADKVARRARVPPEVVEALLQDVRMRLEVVPVAVFAPFRAQARRRVAAAGAEGDEDYVALALALDAPIWTYDKDFRRVRGIRLVTTSEVLGMGRARPSRSRRGEGRWRTRAGSGGERASSVGRAAA